MDCAATEMCCEAVKPIHDMVHDMCNGTHNVTNPCQEDHLGKLKFPMPNASCASINETRRCFEDLIAVVEGPPENESEAAMACPAVQRFMDCAAEQSCCEAVKPIHDVVKDICNGTRQVVSQCHKPRFPRPNATCADKARMSQCFDDLIAVVEGPPENESEAAMACPAVQRFMDCAAEQSCCEAVKPIHDMVHDVCTRGLTNPCRKPKFPAPNATCAEKARMRECFDDMVGTLEGPPENESEAAMACPAVQRFMSCGGPSRQTEVSYAKCQLCQHQ
eukprot:TRINITY_DN8319_c0_g1_i3.p1 TRINITY_DN8319_c0_g1~~TRINITY_DN8319_c0_g1_i3.p1  ORF type:complete len:276 (-),score=57.27 TRINITY_DN8319_c0_g1_i3:670-1497(-)